MRTILRDNYEPVMGAYHEVLLIDEAQNKRWLFDCDGVFTELPTPVCIENEKGESETCAISQKAFTDEVNNLEGDLGDEIQNRTDADDAIWAEIEEIEMSSDVVDIVGTYAELQQYDTSHLNNNDIIKVIADETHDGATSYYRFSESTSSFSYVGSEGPYYTESEVDVLLSGKQDTLTAGTNITITNNTISATDTTYQDFDGATSGTAGASGLVPAPAAGDEGKFLKGDGTWGDAGSTYTAGNGIDITNDEISIDNTVVQEKLTAGTNIQINGNTISATDTTYADFVGTDGQTAGTRGLVPAPSAGDEGKFLQGDGTWGSAAAEPTKFYSSRPSYVGAAVDLYKDSARTTAATYQDVVDALQSGDGVDFIILGDGVTYDQHNIACTYYYDDIGYAPDYYLSVTFTSAGSYWNCMLANDFSSLSSNAKLYWNELKYSLPTAASNTLGGVKVGSNLTISSGVLSANTLVGTDGVNDGAAGYTPAPLAADDGKYLKADGTWAALPGANNISSNDWSGLWQ